MKISIISDEISQDFEKALIFCKSIDVEYVAIRSVWGKNVLNLSDEEINKVDFLLRCYGLKVSSILSPMFKCYLDVESSSSFALNSSFGFSVSLKEHLNMISRLFEICDRLKVNLIRVFSFLKDNGREGEVSEDRIIDYIGLLSREAELSGNILLIENEHSCWVSTVNQLCSIINKYFDKSKNVMAALDPCNHFAIDKSSGFYTEFSKLIPRVMDLHVKDRGFDDDILVVGDGIIDWGLIINEFKNFGYDGFVTMEPHLYQDLDKINESIGRVRKWIY
ncbi:sugar phosphate isomerase/epimerase [Pseudoalteromonas sp. XMcav11-Q]|uniref:sugar phosphate isomerase/epimerase family protein n=1 Tax=Pseudoalteromonas sp. XMcav11-Q TaxID=3136665 RepID=UPI0032C414CD